MGLETVVVVLWATLSVSIATELAVTDSSSLRKYWKKFSKPVSGLQNQLKG